MRYFRSLLLAFGIQLTSTFHVPPPSTSTAAHRRPSALSATPSQQHNHAAFLTLSLAVVLATTTPTPSLADEYGVSIDAPTLYTGETIDICTKRGILGACKKTSRRTVENDNDKASKYQKIQSPEVKLKDVAMRTGSDGMEQSDLISTLQQRTIDNKDFNQRMVDQKTFEANQPGYLGPFNREVLIQNYGEVGSPEASQFTLLSNPHAMRLKKAGYIEGKKFIKPIDQATINKYAEEEESSGIIKKIGRVVTAPFRIVAAPFKFVGGLLFGSGDDQ
ncbi:hypothetical protein TL16_g07274 [Triparma laevis f. inornata]|uniref:Uncharacterized protein n=2 Tax=Triparma laevis TaxID=1534972 RepID=A0A9W7CHN9_9STRA|nr:hypothetical protein TL16_g07274 [Triparma laevis f. inornata]GMI06682.1 hypothetical protein TrLO_g608 [Triparma laevis f. longispina]